MDFITITTADKQNAIADAIVVREAEIWQYQLNIQNYTAMIAGFGPDPLSAEDAKFRDKLAALVITEKAEQAKSIRVLDVLKAQLPADQIVGLVTAAKQRLTPAAAV